MKIELFKGINSNFLQVRNRKLQWTACSCWIMLKKKLRGWGSRLGSCEYSRASRIYIDLHRTRLWIENVRCGRVNRLLKSGLGHTSRIPSYLFALKCRTKRCVDHTAVLKFLLWSTFWEELWSFRQNVYLSDGVSCGLKSIRTVTCNILIQNSVTGWTWLSEMVF